MRTALARELRSQLEKTVIKARDIAELAAREELQRLAVGDKTPADYLTEEQRNLRRSLRAHGRQLGDYRKPEGAKKAGEQGIEHLVTEVAYEHWHRMLFARFLAENNLLMYEDGVTALAIQDCFDLAEEETGDSSNGWHYAANYAARMLPQIFRIDSPVFAINLAPNHQKQLEQLLANLAAETFKASDSLGWVYQFWQTKRKEQINKSEVKIGADELPAVTQLFTEPYMVSFLLDNSLGAWWVSNHPEIECPIELTYLRTLEDGSPAAGRFDGWPKELKDLKTLDPCCGSGHFLVAAFLMLVPMRMSVEGLSATAAVDAVLRDNIHGLELDQRCVELAAFALALEAWRYPDAGGYRALPELQIACSGLGINTKKEVWLALGGDNSNLQIALEELYRQFKDSPVLGSLINPKASLRKGTLFELKWDEIGPLLSKALEGEKDAEIAELGVVAKGLTKTSQLLVNSYTWVITNVPYKKTGEMVDSVDEYLTSNYPYARRSLETSFLARCIEFLISNGTCSVVLPQNWLFLSGYKEFREVLLNTLEWNFVARLGAGAFETISGEHVKAILLTINKTAPILTESKSSTKTLFIDVSNEKSTGDKLMHLQTNNISFIPQFRQLQNPDQRIVMGEEITGNMLSDLASGVHGTNTKDSLRFIRNYWEVDINNKDWELGQTTADTVRDFGGLTTVYFWEKGAGELKWLADRGKAILAGGLAWGKRGISVRQVGHLPCTNYLGSKFDQNCAAIIPSVETNLAAIWCFCSTEEFNKSVREIDQSLKVTNSTLVKVAFDLDHWTQVAKEKYPIGLPEPYSDDPTQWIFHGHPCGSVVWDDTTKWTAQGPLRLDDTVLQVAVVCLLGYQWPAELDAEMELADEQREWVEKSKTLSCFVDDDGIVCLSAVRSEKPAHERIDQLLQAAYGSEWSTHVRNKLLEQVGYKNKSLELWLREKFFEQHCKLFQHRPFIWQLWDGLKDGFSVLVNYHKLDKKNLERLIYTYLDDWIRSQKLQQAEGIDGSTERLAAAEGLKQRLELILEGEAPYDIFVRWKPLAQQPIGWDPDLNDGVRLNIRPFMTVTDVGQKGAGILRAKPNIKWTKDRGKDVESAPWYKLGLEYDGKEGDRINDHHLSLAEKQAENP